MKTTKALVKKLFPILEGNIDPPKNAPADWEPTLEDVAEAVLVKSWELYEQRAKFVVVGQVNYVNGREVKPSDPLAMKNCLSIHATYGEAEKVALSAVWSSDRMTRQRTWVLPLANASGNTVLQSLANIDSEYAGYGYGFYADGTPRPPKEVVLGRLTMGEYMKQLESGERVRGD